MAIIELKGTALNYSAGLGAFDMLNTAWTSTMRSTTSLHTKAIDRMRELNPETHWNYLASQSLLQRIRLNVLRMIVPPIRFTASLKPTMMDHYGIGVDPQTKGVIP